VTVRRLPVLALAILAPSSTGRVLGLVGKRRGELPMANMLVRFP
jgi:hypothetical protein